MKVFISSFKRHPILSYYHMVWAFLVSFLVCKVNLLLQKLDCLVHRPNKSTLKYNHQKSALICWLKLYLLLSLGEHKLSILKEGLPMFVSVTRLYKYKEESLACLLNILYG